MTATHCPWWTVLTLSATLASVSLASADEDAGLCIIAHGSPVEHWNAPVRELGRTVAEEAAASRHFKAVRTAMLEFAQPDVPTAITELEAAGCKRIVAVPLFIAPSRHTHFDLPTVLGIYSSPRMRALIGEDGGRVAQPKVPVVVTQALDGGDLLCRFAVDEVRRLSEAPKEEALVILAHGDAAHRELIDKTMRRIVTYCCGQTGIDYADWAYVGMGQGYAQQALPTYAEALEHKKRVLVVGIYVASSARSIHERGMRTMPETLKTAVDSLEDRLILSARQGVVTYHGTPKWVLEAATNVLDSAANVPTHAPGRTAVAQNAGRPPARPGP